MTGPNSPAGEPTAEASGFLLHQWIAAGMVSAASRFVPIPYVDDIIRGWCHRFVIARTLAAHHVPVALADLKPYYATGGGCLSGCAATLMRAPLKLLLFPIRKAVAVVTSIRGVPLEIIRVVLLGRTLDRYLRSGKIGAAPATTAETAARMRVAFNEAFVRMDFHAARAATSDALSRVSGWKEAAIASASKIASEDKADGGRESAGGSEPGDVPFETSPAIDSGADRVQEVLSRPETLELFAEFDQRFDTIFDRLPLT